MDFQMPSEDELNQMTPDQLRTLRRQAQDQFQSRYSEVTKGGRVATGEELDELQTFIDSTVTVLDARIDEAVKDEKERQERQEQLKPAENVDEAESKGEENDEEDDDEDNEAKSEQEERESVAASAGRERADFLGLGQDKPGAGNDAPKFAFEIARGVPGEYPAQAGFGDLDTAFKRVNDGAMVRSMRSSNVTSPAQAVTLATLDKRIREELLVGESPSQESLVAAIDAALDTHNLPGGSLVAAGGWCSPSQVLYEFLDVPEADGLFELPEIGMPRGGIRFPVQPDFGRAMQEQGFLFTEAQMITNETDPEFEKPCFSIPCPGWDEVRLDAIGLCITADLLQQKGFPESVEVYMKGLLAMHAHRYSSYRIQKVLAESDAVTIPGTHTVGALTAVLNAVGRAVADIKALQRLPESATLEVTLPRWFREAAKEDALMRRSEGMTTPLTNEQINALFAQRSVRVQWVSDWQVGGTGEPGANTPMTRWPETVKFIVYPAGTFLSATEPVIEVGNLYDQAQLRKNKFTALFTEDGVAVAKRGPLSRVYTVSLDPAGFVGPEGKPVYAGGVDEGN